MFRDSGDLKKLVRGAQGVDSNYMFYFSQCLIYFDNKKQQKINTSVIEISYQYLLKLPYLMSDKKQEGSANKNNRNQDVVSQDRNWVLRINSQIESQKKWGSQWGYLSGGFSPQKATTGSNINQKIQQLEREVAQIEGGTFSKTSDSYGKGQKLQMFDDDKFNMQKNKDLRPLQRKLPKGWKKQKWTPPADPFDPLSKLSKKK